MADEKQHKIDQGPIFALRPPPFPGKRFYRDASIDHFKSFHHQALRQKKKFLYAYQEDVEWLRWYGCHICPDFGKSFNEKVKKYDEIIEGNELEQIVEQSGPNKHKGWPEKWYREAESLRQARQGPADPPHHICKNDGMPNMQKLHGRNIEKNVKN